MAELDMINRDPNELNGFIKASFEDVLGEPDDAHSFECVWTASNACFNCGRDCCYKFVTLLCGLCVALYWGCCFAVVAFETIWCMTPLLRVVNIICNLFQKFYTICITCWLAPCCETLGLFFSRITVVNK